MHTRGHGARSSTTTSIHHKGTQPGSPLADIAYNYYMSFILKELQNYVDNDEGIQHGAAQLGQELTVNRGGVGGRRRGADCLRNQRRPAGSSQAHHQVRGGHAPCPRQQFSKGKTELLINYRGKGAREHRKKTFLDDKGTIRIHDGDRVYPQ